MRFRPAPLPQWEVIDLKEVAPTPMYYDDDDDLQISRVAPHEVMGTYTFDVSGHLPLGDAVKHSRAKFMEEISKQGGYNFLVLEGWSITVMRKKNARRLQVRYYAHPAIALGGQQTRTPPFLALLDNP
ncbi:hypothetical protein BS47DRAFT_1394902 [Hydnum rufescens UP504]|uniref:Uncharacterized protein n=1 Tax=Hydnum rufescens UP504 TaxID=1448309 RepID=A0A9P6ATH4_9AGAM|nr:hypothetical protein BS47DRAFT_1394902 [Hydnum rufescens UP504]